MIVYIIFTLGALVIGLLVEFLDPTPGPIPCYSASYFPIVMVQGGIYLIAGTILTLKIRKARDTYLIRGEFLICIVFSGPLVVVWAVSFERAWIGVVFQHFWLGLADIGYLMATITLPIFLTWWYSARIKKERGRMDVFTSAAPVDDEIKVVINNEILGAAFEKYATAAWAVENLVFYNRVEMYKRLSSPELSAEARVIHDEFVAEGEFPFEFVYYRPPFSHLHLHRFILSS